MAPFRSSRSTRNNDPATMNRGRGGVIDHDPTEGLPVRNWYLSNINIKQDEPVAVEDDQQPSANTINPDYPWPELRLPSFYAELPPLSQQIVRVARSGRPVKPSVYDKKTGTYISHAEYATRNALKSKHLENVDSPAAEDDDEMDEVLDVKGEMEKQERAFALRKWAQVPPAVADKRAEPKYLADRRPGMRSLYGFQAAILNPALNANATGAATAGLDLGDGSGLGNATGVLAAGTDQASMAVPAVKRMPPKRKKKGGPGRKKANLGSGPSTANGSAVANSASGAGVKAEGGAGQTLDGSTVDAENDTHMEDGHDGEDDKGDEGSGSDEEGSEEGEIDEGHPQDVDMKLEDGTSVPDTTPPELNEAPSTATTTELTISAEIPVVESVTPTVDVAGLTENATVPTVNVEEHIERPEPELDPALEPVPSQPTEDNDTKVDFLGSLDNAVADMEREE